MKKQLLFALSIGMCIGFSAKAQVKAAKGEEMNNQQNLVDNTAIGFYPAGPAKPFYNTNRAVSKKKIGSSWNALTLLVSASNCLTANQATNTILFTHRISKDWAATNVNSGFIQSTFTTNGGATWDSLLQTQEQSPVLCRYPSGAIFNPNGNTTPGNAFAVVSGPFTNGLTPNGWRGNYFASTQLNKTNNNVNIRLNGASGVIKQHFARISIQSTDDKVIVTGGLYGGEPDAATLDLQAYRGAVINYAKPSGSNFLWTLDSIKPNFKWNTAGGYNFAYNQTPTAWSQDGQTGYVVFTGIDNSATGANLTYQPLVWKTTNGGTSWSQLPLFDFASIPAINAKTRYTTDGTLQKAFFTHNNGIDVIVDANNNLHIVCQLYSGFTTSPDSLTYIYTAQSNNNVTYMFDTYTTATGWDALFIDSLNCVPAVANSPLADGAGAKYSIDARLQVSKSTDGTHLFYAWVDSDPNAANGENILPEIRARGWNMTSNKLTPTVQFTSDGINYYLFASNITLVNGTTYTIPATVSMSRLGDGNTENTWDHYYVSGIQFDESEFVGINEIVKNGNLSISQNYPNPFANTTSIDVTLQEATNVSIAVYNTIGQNVISQNADKLNAGTHTFTIDGSSLKAGIYFYTVKTGDASITQKMIVQ